MDTERTCANLERPLHRGAGPALPHCMSHAPWSGQGVCRQLQAASQALPALAQGSTLMLDARADEQAGPHNAGASRPSHGRRGQGEVGRGDTCLPSANSGRWARVDGDLFWPAEGLGAACAQRRRELGIPAERHLETQSPWGWKMIKRVKAPGGPCALLACDARSGRESPLRADWAAADVQSAAQGPAATVVSRSEPPVGLPPKRRKRGRPRPRRQVLRGQGPQEGRALAQPPQTTWQQGQGRPTERGRLIADCAERRVWPVAAGQRPRTACWVIRRHREGDCS